MYLINDCVEKNLIVLRLISSQDEGQEWYKCINVSAQETFKARFHFRFYKQGGVR